LAAYVEAGADAVGVQLNETEEFRLIGTTAPAPLVSMWPRARMSAFEFINMGYRVALMPSSVPVAAVTAAREVLLELKRFGRDQNYFARQREFSDSESWYRNLGTTHK
jgi:2-methylisocitrate lyase-like PEP mutase family enzyme